MKILSFGDPNLLAPSVVISAGAGSGKTFTLSVFVLLALGRSEARSFEIYATTFSEASASDLKERLLRPLDLLAALDIGAWRTLLPMNDHFGHMLESLALSPGLSKSAPEVREASPHFGHQPWMDSPAKAQAFWRKTRREAELMHVSTIHSLALGLLRTGKGNPEQILDAGHPALLRLLRQAMRETASPPVDHPDSAAATTLLEWAEKRWLEISHNHDGHRDTLGHFGGKPIDEAREELLTALEKARLAFAPFATNNKLAVEEGWRTNRYFDPEKLLPPPKPGAPLSELIRWAEGQSNRMGLQDSKIPDYYSPEFKSAYQTLREVATAWEACLRAILACGLERFETLKRDRGMATFGDMVRAALHGLRDGSIPPPRPKLLLVDECQDTSRAQDAFLDALEAARIVRVGDVKQAIYSFRGGVSDLLLGHIAANEESSFRLAYNYRSSPPIVEMANHYVKTILTGKEVQQRQIDEDQISTKLDEGCPPVGIVLVPSESIGADLPAIAGWIRSLSAESGWEGTLGESRDHGLTSSKKSSKALLLRQRTKLPELLVALKRHGINPYVLAKDGFWDSPGVRLLMTALEAAAHPNRPLPCAVLLRHLAGLNDAELHRMMPLRGMEQIDLEQMAEAKRPLVAWLRSIMTFSAPALAAELLAQGNLLAIVSSVDAHGPMEPVRARRNLSAFLELLQGLPADTGSAFTQLSELRKSKERGDVPANCQDADLLIQTIHGSKGLEYDDVILPLLSNRAKSVRNGQILTDPDDGSLLLAWRLGAEPGKNYTKVAKLIQQRQKRDDLNLFYVAITRAKKRLFLLVQKTLPKKPENEAKDQKENQAKTKKQKKEERENNHVQWNKLGKEMLEGYKDLKEIDADPPVTQLGRSEKPTLGGAEIIPQPTAAASPQAPALGGVSPGFEDTEDNLRARREGEAVHAYLQNLLVRWEDEAAFNRVLDDPPPVERARECALRFLASFESRGWRHLRRRTEMGLEGASASGTKGRADLIVWDKDRVHIIDFKNTHRLTPESGEIYAQQLNRYARAMRSHNAPDKPINAWLALLKSGEWVAVDTDVSK